VVAAAAAAADDDTLLGMVDGGGKMGRLVGFGIVVDVSVGVFFVVMVVVDGMDINFLGTLEDDDNDFCFDDTDTDDDTDVFVFFFGRDFSRVVVVAVRDVPVTTNFPRRTCC
jgi:hypothetical protein